MAEYAMPFVFSLLISILITFSTALDTIDLIQSIRDRNNDTLVSTEGIFELGFFSPPELKGRYLGIWYKKGFPRTIVWVANRKNPLVNNLGALNITSQGILVLLNGTNDVVWSSNIPRVALKNPIAQLLESGNLVIRDGNDLDPENYLWQSFDYPCDTLLPGMKLGVNLVTGLERFLSSWKSLEDPAPGQFSLHINPHGYPQLFLMKGSKIQFRVPPWNGQRIPRIHVQEFVTSKLVFNEKEIYFMYELKNRSILSRLYLNPLGITQRFSWNDRANDWVVSSTAIIDRCQNYALCGAYASCNVINSTVCSCLKGFRPKAPRNWSSSVWSDGCARSIPLGCNNMDRFLTYTGMKLPDTSSSLFYNSTSLKDCEQLCLKNCSCSAYANIGRAGSDCLIWFNELIDASVLSEDGQNVYVRVAASELENIDQKNSSGKRKKAGIVASVVILFIGMLMVGLICYILRRKLNLQDAEVRNCGKNDNLTSGKEDVELPIFELKTIADATNNFSNSNKLGEGGFGHVYKGNLMGGQEIAVKRLSKSSSQGLNEFMNEVALIANLQHRNLVKLLGCCVHGNEKMLIYEYMPNKSLDYFVFDQTRSKLLDWQMRIHIIEGIARGLLYLHEDSRLRIIHRDLKAGNVLLDKDMNPKISDFGLARTFGETQTEANTNRVVGTYGYMSPEYAMDGLFSVKSDVFSFGVLALEIVSGKRNRGFCHPNHSLNLLGHAWIQWTKGIPLQLIDECLSHSSNLSEVIRCIHVALLCVQQRPEDRPNMSSVVLMLGSENSLPQPKQPGLIMRTDAVQATTSLSANEVTMTSLEAR